MTGPRELPHLSLGGVVGRIGVSLATFVGILFVVRTLAAPGGGGIVGAKLEHYRADAERYDTVFLGSSHVYRSFVPEVFDRLLGVAGRESRSFNFGVQLPNLYENHYLLREILRSGQGTVKRVFCEYMTLTPQIDPQNAFIPRTIYWHDFAETSVAVARACALADELDGNLRFAEDPSRSITSYLARPFPVSWRIGVGHMLHFASRGLMVGRGKDVAKGLLGRRHGQTAVVASGAGYLSLEDQRDSLAEKGQAANPYQRRHDHFLESLPDYDARVSALAERSVVFGDEEWMNADLQQVDDIEIIRLMVAECRHAGVEFVLVIMPGNSCNRPFEERLRAELDVPVLRYNLPKVYPRLYEAQYRFDSGHLSAPGALEFTRLLARDYLNL